MKFQGRWYVDAIRDVTGLDSSYFTIDKLESYGNANLLKGGIVYADHITTVSETYAKEIQSTERWRKGWMGSDACKIVCSVRNCQWSGL